MKPLAALREAILNVLTGAAGWWAEVPLLLLALCFGVGVDLHAKADSLRQIDERRTAGGYGKVIVGEIDGVRCEGLNGIERLTAGAYRRIDTVSLLEQPGSSVPVIEITPTAMRFFSPRVPAVDGLYITEALAKQLADPDVLHLASGDSLSVTSVLRPPEHVLANSRAIISVTSARGLFSNCLVDRWPPRLDDNEILLSVSTAEGQALAKIEPLNEATTTAVVPSEEFTNRPTRLLPVIGLGAVSFIVLITFRLRRKQLSLARHLGLGRFHLAVISILEHSAALAVASILVSPWLATAFVDQSQTTARYLLSEMSIQLLWAWSALVVTSTVSALSTSGHDVLQRLRDS